MLQGVLTIGQVPAGLPSLRWPGCHRQLLGDLLPAAIGLALVSFTSGMVTARSFAARNHYEIDVDRELIALGACNIAAGLSQGFAVTGADSRTAVNDAMGGKSQVTGLVAAATMTMVLLFFTGPLQYLPVCALGAVLMSAALGLFDWKAMVRLYRIREGELGRVRGGDDRRRDPRRAAGHPARDRAVDAGAADPFVTAVRRACLAASKGCRLSQRGAPRRRDSHSRPRALSLQRVGDLLQCRLLQASRARGRRRQPGGDAGSSSMARRSCISTARARTPSLRSPDELAAAGQRLVIAGPACAGRADAPTQRCARAARRRLGLLDAQERGRRVCVVRPRRPMMFSLAGTA